MLSDDQLLQIILIADGIAIHFQYYLNDQLKYLILGVSTAAFHIVLYFIEQFCRNLYLRTTFNILKLLLLLFTSYTLNPAWMIYTGMQISCIIKGNTKLTKIAIFSAFCAHIIALSFANIDYLPISIIRNCLSYLLILIYFEKPNYNIAQLSDIIKQITAPPDMVIMLDSHFSPLHDWKIFETILNEQIIIYQDDKTDRIATHRESFTLGVQMKLLDDKGIVQLDQIISSLKQNNTSWLNQQFETISDCRATIKKVDFNYRSFCCKKEIPIQDTLYLLIKKTKTAQHDFSAQDQTKSMMKTLSKVSHDMRTPLNAIINMQICLKDQIDPSLTDRYLKPSLNSCRLLLNLVNDILDQAQLQSNKIRLVFRKFNLKKMIEKTITIFDIQREKKELKIQLNYSVNVPEYINSDKNRVRQIVMNLLSNAVKYSVSKGSIQINCEFLTESQQVVTISVVDTGLGIKPENLNKLFQEFAKVDDKENRDKNPNGIGLGLLISNELSKVLSQNGEGIRVTTEYGSGSTFQFSILHQKNPDEDLSFSDNSDAPIHEVNPFPESRFISQSLSFKSREFAVAVRQPSSDSLKGLVLISNSNIKKYNLRVNSSNLVSSNRLLPFTVECEKSFLRKSTNQSNQIIEQVNTWMEQTSRLPPVLIVDDNEFNIVVLQYILEQLYLTCDSAISGLIAIQRCKERARQFSQYKVIFLDIEMPDMDGIETSTKLLEFDSTLKIIACTGYRQNPEQLEQYKKAGMQGVIEKPVTKAHLRDLLCKFTDQKIDAQFSHYF